MQLIVPNGSDFFNYTTFKQHFYPAQFQGVQGRYLNMLVIVAILQ